MDDGGRGCLQSGMEKLGMFWFQFSGRLVHLAGQCERDKIHHELALGEEVCECVLGASIATVGRTEGKRGWD
jgi:hypothetical protein